MDERIEFLMQSIASHDRQLGGLAERMDVATANINALAERIGELTSATQLSFDRLTTAMLALTDHIANHERRIERLEG